MTLLDVMIAVGGITDFADGNGATILRTTEGNKQYSVRIRDLIKRGDVSANVEMRPGDVNYHSSKLVLKARFSFNYRRARALRGVLARIGLGETDSWKNS